MPYLSFEGNCEEALLFYKEAFGGKMQHLVHYGDMPENPDAPMDEDTKRRVMHAMVQLTPDGGAVSGADAIWPVESGNAVSLQAHFETEAEAQRVFKALSAGGEIIADLLPNPPPDDSSVSGMLKDRFGFSWVLSALRDR